MADHKIVLTLTDDIHAVPSSHTTIAKVGDTLRYDTNPPGLPFESNPRLAVHEGPVLVIEDRNPRVLEAEGRFFWKCFLQRPRDKKFVGWVSARPGVRR